MAARIAAARVLGGRSADARAPARGAACRSRAARRRVDARDRALARSIATVALRRLGTIRKALARRLEKGKPKRGRGARMDADRRRGADPVSRCPRSCGRRPAVKATRADPAGRRSRGSPTRCCARSPASATPFWRVPIRLRTTRPDGPTAGEELTGEGLARAIAAAHRAEPTLDISVKSNAEDWAARLGGTVLPTGSVRLDTHTPVAELEGYSTGEWWCRTPPRRCRRGFSGLLRECESSLRRAGRQSCRTRRGWRGSDDGRPLGRAPAARRQFRAPAPSLRDRGRRRARLRCAAVRRRAPGCAVPSDRHHPPPSRRRLDQAAGRSPLDQASGPIARSGDRAHTLWRSDRLLRLFARTQEGEAGPVLRRNPDARRSRIAAEEIGGLAECLTPAGHLRCPAIWGDDRRRSGLDGFFRCARLVKAG